MAGYKETLQIERQGKAFCKKVGKIEKIPANEKQGMVQFKAGGKTPSLTSLETPGRPLAGFKVVQSR